MSRPALPYLLALALACLALQPSAWAEHADHAQGPCDDMSVWDIEMGMCMPLPMEGMPMRMLMLHGNAFAVGVFEQGPRGRDRFAAPNMLMLDIGSSMGDRQYVNLDVMGTTELWTFPQGGYPELLQIGETQANGAPFLDAQHPHSSPIMGLTLSDTIRLDTGGQRDHLKVFFAPRGESTDGPIAFMHRPTGLANPDAPLGHHIGQDVGHISSTVIGASLKLGLTRIEFSAFNGTEPDPTRIDLPLGTPNSYALRLVRELSPETMAMASAAYVQNPEPDQPDLAFVARYSASLYAGRRISTNWHLDNALIFGLITKYDNASVLASFDEEFLFRNERSRVFGRLEFLQRTAAELEIPGTPDPNLGVWVTAATLGYTFAVEKFERGELGLGGSVTKDFIPAGLSSAYGGDPWTGKVFLQLSGMAMWDL